VLNIVFLALAATLLWRFFRTGGRAMLSFRNRCRSVVTVVICSAGQATTGRPWVADHGVRGIREAHVDAAISQPLEQY
jgi:hypothetical protein